MFDLDQTFSPNILPLLTKACASGEKYRSEASHVVIFSSNTQKSYVGSLCPMFGQTLFVSQAR